MKNLFEQQFFSDQTKMEFRLSNGIREMSEFAELKIFILL